MKSSSESWSSISATSCEWIVLQPAGGVSLRGETVTPPRPLS